MIEEWKWGLPRGQFATYCKGQRVDIIGIEMKTELFDCDRTREWLVIKTGDGKKHKLGSQSWEAFFKLFEFEPGWNGLFKLTLNGSGAAAQLVREDEYLAKNKAEYDEYLRLKEKFGE